MADIFQAMVQDRPYRRGLDETELLGMALRAMLRQAPNIILVDPLAGNTAVYGVAVDNSGLRTTSPTVTLTFTNPPSPTR